MNCPNCGAAVKEGKFCNYCGAKLPDDTKRVEVNINKHIEDVAEIKRASYEEQESKIRQKQMKQNLRKHTFVKFSGILAVAGILMYILSASVFHWSTGAFIGGGAILLGALGILLALAFT